MSLFQMKELMSSFLNSSELTEDLKIDLSHRLGITEDQVVHFFQTQSKKPRYLCVEAYSKLLKGKGLKCITESAHAFNSCLSTYMYIVHMVKVLVKEANS